MSPQWQADSLPLSHLVLSVGIYESHPPPCRFAMLIPLALVRPPCQCFPDPPYCPSPFPAHLKTNCEAGPGWNRQVVWDIEKCPAVESPSEVLRPVDR